jgi:L-alanine-DL-glutamate epimerase-like enolase superfamily enzyme
MSLRARLFHVSVPMKMAIGHAVSVRDKAEAIVVIVESDHFSGIGECVPRPYVTGEDYDTAWAAIQSVDLNSVVERVDFRNLRSATASIEKIDFPRTLKSPVPALAAGCALELALLDIATKRTGLAMREIPKSLGLSSEIVSDEILPERVSTALDFMKTPEALRPYVGRLSHLKVKVGLETDRDEERLKKCREIYGPNFPISVDVNMAWSLADALRIIPILDRYGILWYEEPLKPDDRKSYPELRRRTGAKIMLDESACGYDQVAAAIQSEACDLINIRLSKCGGFIPSLRLVELSHRNGIKFQLGVQVGQLGILNAAGRNFTSAVKGIVACEGGIVLGNLSDRIIEQELSIDWQKSALSGLKDVGIGVDGSLEKLEKYSVRIATWAQGRWS